jgi:hypothetical protein
MFNPEEAQSSEELGQNSFRTGFGRLFQLWKLAQEPR